MRKKLQVLQANLRKMAETQLSLLNDEDLAQFGLLLIQEPHSSRINGQVVTTPRYHPYWTPYQPTESDPDHYWPFRSMIWVHKDLTARQFPVASPDITGLVVELKDRRILAISIYIPPKADVRDETLTHQLELLAHTMSRARRYYAPHTVEVLIGGDFNRHDQLWGGDAVGAGLEQGRRTTYYRLRD